MFPPLGQVYVHTNFGYAGLQNWALGHKKTWPYPWANKRQNKCQKAWRIWGKDAQKALEEKWRHAISQGQNLDVRHSTKFQLMVSHHRLTNKKLDPNQSLRQWGSNPRPSTMVSVTQGLHQKCSLLPTRENSIIQITGAFAGKTKRNRK